MKTVGANTEKDFQEKADAGRRESSGLRGEVNTMAATLASLREELKNNEKKEQKKTSELLKTISLLNDEKLKLQNSLNESNLSMTNSNQKSLLELNLIRKKMDDRENDLNIENKQKEQAQKNAFEKFNAKHIAEIENEKLLQNKIAATAEAKEKLMQVTTCLFFIYFYSFFVFAILLLRNVFWQLNCTWREVKS